MEGAILLLMALGGLGIFGVGVVLLVWYWRSSRSFRDEPIVYGNLVQCPRCNYMNPMDSAACLSCQYPLSHQRHAAYQPPPSPTYPTLPPQYAQRPAPPPNAPSHYAPPGTEQSASNADQTVAQSRTPLAHPPAPQSYDPSVTPDTVSAPAAARMQPTVQTPANAPGGMPNAWVEGESGVLAGQRTTLVLPDTLFGRSTQCDVQIYDPKVSRQHFIIRYGEGSFYLQDQGSSRGTMINGERVIARRLEDGDRIELGDSLLVFHVETL